MKDFPCPWINKINIIKVTTLKKVNYICNTIIMRIPIAFWAEPKKKFLKFLQKHKRLDRNMKVPDISLVWWNMLLIPPLQRQRQAEALWICGQSGLHSEFLASQGYVERPCFQKQSKNWHPTIQKMWTNGIEPRNNPHREILHWTRSVPLKMVLGNQISTKRKFIPIPYPINILIQNAWKTLI